MSSDRIYKVPVISNSNGYRSSYTVTIGAGLLGRLSELIMFEKFSSVGLIVDETVKDLWLEPVIDSVCRPVTVFAIPQGEDQKSIEMTQLLWREFSATKLDRASIILCLGGGVVTDLGGFAAATFMRGIACVHLPTTLLGQVDASVGGKVGINFDGQKNLIGAFATPHGVIADTTVLETLPEVERRSGLAEMIKHALAFDRDYADDLTDLDPRLPLPAETARLVARSVELKAAIVERDEREVGIRRLLNLGHTVGHALESLSHETEKPLRHGEAVAIGLVAEARIAELVGLLSARDRAQVKTLIGRFELPVRLDWAVSSEKVIDRILQDKKVYGGVVRWPLLSAIGSAKLDVDVPLDIVRQGVAYVAGS
jgi:3-dehydroquinate synthase